MYVFHFDPATKRFLGADPGEFDQLEPGRMIVPAWATAKPTPPMRDGFWRVFDIERDEWAYEPMQQADAEASD